MTSTIGRGDARRGRLRGSLVGIGALLLSTLSCSWIVGGSAEEEGPKLAKRIRAAADLPCIESWVAQVAKQTPLLKGGTDIDQAKWPECIRAIRVDEAHSIEVIRVVLSENGGATLYLGRIWRLTAGVPVEERPGRWAVSKNAYLWYVES